MKKLLSTLVAVSSMVSLSLPAFAYTWPTEGTTINWSFSSQHQAVDIAPLERGVAGDEIYAFYDGEMTKFKWDKKAGYTSHIAHTNPESTGSYDEYLLSRNQHQLNPADESLSTSGDVSEGDVIGYMGTTGSTSEGVHLHFETVTNSTAFSDSSGWYDGSFVDPVDTFFPEYASRRALQQIEPLSSEAPLIGITVENRFYDARGIAAMSQNELAVHGITASQIQDLLPKLQGNKEYVSIYGAVAQRAR